MLAFCVSALVLTCATVGERDRQDQIIVRITGLNISAAFSYQVDDYTVTFHDKSTGILIQWAWSFGDGSGPSHERNPVHEYTTRATFQVQLRVTDESGIVAEAIKRVRIADPADTRFYTVVLGVGLLMIGVVLLTKGNDNGQLAGLVAVLAAILILATLAFREDFVAQLIAFFDGLWRSL
jgi:hypothetical protein